MHGIIRLLLCLLFLISYRTTAEEPSFDSWTFSKGTEFPGADGYLDKNLKVPFGTRKAFELSGDFRKGGVYVAASHTLTPPVNLREFHFRVRSGSKRIAVRFVDSDHQVHQHFIPLTGDPSVWQCLEIPAAGSSRHHWGGKNDGVLRGEIKQIAIVLSRDDLPEKKGSLCAADFRILKADRTLHRTSPPLEWNVENPTALFRRTGDASPAVVRAILPGNVPGKYLRYSYRDYSGSEVASGYGNYNAERKTLSAPPPPGRGFYELVWPELQIHLGLAVDDPPPAESDEYFAMDSSLSWGPPPADEKGIRDFLRILKKNGICWNRDRLSWPDIEPEQGKFNFSGRFGLYRRIAAEEGIKALDTFHVAPKWSNRHGTSFRKAHSRLNLYPDNLIAAGESWNSITKHWNMIKALEIWNEPDIGWGNFFPAEYVCALTKAVSRIFADNGNKTLIVGGVFAHTRPETGFYASYLNNGLLDDCDVISYHAYTDVPNMEPQVAALRQAELDSGSDRAGIPYWLTESGKPRPWSGTSRGSVAADMLSAVEITGKAAELRALGLARYFAFEYKFRREKENSFGQMDANRTPMRGMAAYLHLVRVLSHRSYIGDLKGANAFRARVFENENDLVAVLYNGLQKFRKQTVILPAGLKVRKANGIDGRPLNVENGSVSNADGITYLYLDRAMKRNFVNPDTKAMALYRLAKNYKPKPRAAKPLVLQSVTDLSEHIVCNRGLYVPNADRLELKLRINNFGDETLKFIPELNLPEGGRVLECPAAAMIPPRGWKELRFRLALNPHNRNGFQTLRILDGNGNATPAAFSLAPFRREKIELESMPSGTRSPATLAELETLGGWIDFSGSANWTPWEGDKTVPDIEARFRGFYTPEKLVLQVLVKDAAHVNPYEAFDSWRGDSVQFVIQQRKKDKLPTGRYHEITAAKCAEGKTLYAHIGSPKGKLKRSSLDFRSVGRGWYLYEIQLDGKELGLELKPGSVLGSSLIVNSNPGRGRAGFLNWGLGIAPEKSDALFQLLQLR